MEDGGLWKEVLESRYGSWRNLNVDLTNKKCFIWWRDLGRVCNYGPFNNWFDGNFIWKVGDGKTIRFWEDNWVDDQSLQQKYPRLYMLSLCKDKTVKEVSDWV